MGGDVDWAQARAWREGEGLTFTEIARRLGRSVSAVRSRAKKEAWGAPKKNNRRRTEISPVCRIMKLVQAEIDEVERAMAATEGASTAGDRERSARTLISLLKSYEMVEDMKVRVNEKTHRKRSKDPASTNNSQEVSAEDIRREIKRRLDRIVACTSPDSVDRKSE